MFGANATATPDGGLLQLRALDWNVDGRIWTKQHIFIQLKVEAECSHGTDQLARPKY